MPQMTSLRSLRTVISTPSFTISTLALKHIRTMSSLPSKPTKEQLAPLYSYTACDISDALLKLKVPGAGFLADLQPYCPPKPKNENEDDNIVIAPASTVIFAPRTGDNDETKLGPGNIPKDKHWVDMTEPDTIVVESQPAGQKNAVLGGIMAARMKYLNAKAIVVGGRIRDLVELSSTGLPIWAMGTSTVGAGAESKPHAINVPVDVSGVTVNPGDIVFSDQVNGVVVIPRNKLAEVIALLPKLVEADDKVKEDVNKGMSVQEAFKKHRSNL